MTTRELRNDEEGDVIPRTYEEYVRHLQPSTGDAILRVWYDVFDSIVSKTLFNGKRTTLHRKMPTHKEM